MAKVNGLAGFSLGITVLGLGVALYLIWEMRRDIQFWVSSPAAIDLGEPQRYQLDRAQDNVHATIRGQPGRSADRFRRLGKRFEIVAIQGTPFLVRRHVQEPVLPRPQGEPEPPPDQSLFAASGRLLQDDSMPAYAHAYRLLVERGEALPRSGHLFVLLDGERPRAGWQTPASLLAVGLLAALNIWSLARYAKRLNREKC
jgi:hypothetical protein